MSFPAIDFNIAIQPALVARPTSSNALDRALDSFQTEGCNGAMHAIRIARDAMQQSFRDFSCESDWRLYIDKQVRTHPVVSALHEDPFVGRAFQKPRGYAGDAVLLDFIYRNPAIRKYTNAATPRGRACLGLSTNTPAPRAVRNRAWLLANEIDAVCARTPSAEILSMACGHLREAGESNAVASSSFGRFVAVDQDVESLAVVTQEAGPSGVEAVEGSVKSMIMRGKELGEFDFVYAAGLFDYLNDKVAARLISTFWNLLKPGGKLWVANFLPGIADRAFMESFMDWWLIYRTPEQMLDISASVSDSACARRRTFVEPESNIVFLEMFKD